MHLVIVESPTKAKTIRKFLGAEYRVIASVGHVRDLPQSSADVPAAYKKTSWGSLGVNVEQDFEPLYVVPKNKTKTITELKQALKEADALYLATDEDREGESISWHLLQILKPKVPVYRMVFHEITREAIQSALSHPRELDDKLVRAQETRRILDRLVGYSVSPVLWKKLTYGLSAGRVQSVALKAIVDRERERLAFRKGAYWDVSAALQQNQQGFEARLTMTDGKRVAAGRDFDEKTGGLKTEAKDILLLDETAARRVMEDAKSKTWSVTDVTEKNVARRPAPPFTTSTLQQEANRKLGLSSKDAMRTAQALYEQGFITYMRTDSVTLSEEAVTAARAHVTRRFGEEFVPDAARRYATTSKGAQEAHEAIRPSLNFTAPDETGLQGAEHKLYELIWMRTLASQMKDSAEKQTNVTLHVASHVFTASGLTILFPGFLRAYVEGAEDTEQALTEKERPLPKLAINDEPRCTDAKAEAHETKPPARFTEAGLVQFMEKEGIGRPSTYASVISTLLDRGYVRKQSHALVPTFTAFAVAQLLERHFSDLVDLKFTSRMEETLDEIAAGTQAWLPYLQTFFLGDEGLQSRVKRETENIDPEQSKIIDLPNLAGTKVRVGKFGPYIETLQERSGITVKTSLPEDLAPSELTTAKIEELASHAQQGPTSLGTDPASGKQIYLKTGAYGPYLQLGGDEEEKPKRVSIPKHIPLETLDLTRALALLSLPRNLGAHPQSGKDVKAGLGRFGPYVVHDGEFRSLKGEDDVLTVSLERALELLAQPKGTRGNTHAALKTIGTHPTDGKPITLHAGRFGQYIKHKTTSVTIPKEISPEELTLNKAVELLKEKRAKKKTK